MGDSAEERAGADRPRLWYVAVHGQVFGPADLQTLRHWAAAGRLGPGSHLCPADGGSWRPLAEVPELQELLVLAPPPLPTAARPPRPVAGEALCACPHCTGPVLNVALVYGWPWGFWQRALKPEFACGSCGTPIGYDELTPEAQARVTRTMRTGFALWVVVVVAVILAIASPFFVAMAYH